MLSAFRGCISAFLSFYSLAGFEIKKAANTALPVPREFCASGVPFPPIFLCMLPALQGQR
jgi:hypothetical protein